MKSTITKIFKMRLIIINFIIMTLACVYGQSTSTIISKSDTISTSRVTTTPSSSLISNATIISQTPNNSVNNVSLIGDFLSISTSPSSFTTNTNNNSLINSTIITEAKNSNNITALHSTSKFTVKNITQLKILDVEFLQLYLFPMEHFLEFEIQLNLTKWNAPNAEDIKLDDDEKKLKLHIGLEREQEQSIIDIVSISLNNGNFDENVSSSRNDSNASSGIKDSYWNPKLGIITIDKDQNYKLKYFNENANKSFFSIKFVRPWLTCDEKDVQFTVRSHPVYIPSMLKLYWSIIPEGEKLSELNQGFNNSYISQTEVDNTMIGKSTTQSSPRQSTTTSMPTKTISTISQLGDEALNSSSVTTMSSLTTTLIHTVSSRKPANHQLAAEDDGKDATSSVVKTTTQPPVLRTLKDYKFQGPVNVSLSELFQNFTNLHLKGCGKIHNTIYQCSPNDFKIKTHLNSESTPLFIIQAIHYPNPNNSIETGKTTIVFDGKTYSSDVCPKDALNFRGWSQGRRNNGGKSLDGKVDVQQENHATSLFTTKKDSVVFYYCTLALFSNLNYLVFGSPVIV